MKVIHHEFGRDPLYKTWNSCEDFMILYMYSDGGSIVFQDKIYPIEQGAICLISPKIQHYTMPADPSKYDRSKIYISEETVSDILKMTYQDDEFYNLFTNNPVIYAQIPCEHRREIEDIYYKAKASLKEGWKASFIQQFFQLMTLLKRFTAQHISIPSDPITSSIKYINQSFHLPLTLDDICREMHISKYHFCRKFKECVGMTVMQYILDTRLAAAKRILTTEDVNITEVCERCGFSSFSYFCQTFKKYNNMSPSAYRKASRK